jgi:hypothetical protein
VLRGRARRAFAALVVAVAVAALLPASAGPPPPAPLSVPGFAARPARGPGAASETAACADPAGTWLGTRWRTPLHWRFNAATTPAYLGSPAAVRATIARAAHNVAAAANPCGLTGRLAATVRLDGGTNRVAAVRPDGGCGTRDGVSEVSFGRLAPGLLAVTCLWWRPGGHGRDGTTVEADILVSAEPGLFFQTRPAGCGSAWDLEGALTHEFGHAFGLGHVTADEHPELTMSDALAPCDASHRGLGLGDYDTLRAHY